MKKVRAKFVCNSRRESGFGSGQVTQVEVEMHPVYSEDPGHENKRFWDTTPAGSLSMTITNPGAFDAFQVGQEYYLDFTPAPREGE